MKRLGAILALFFASFAAAQTPPPLPVTASQVIWPLYSDTPPVNFANTQLVGNPGPQTYFYWFVAHYTLGVTSPSGPFVAANAPNVLSGSNYIKISPTYPVGSADEVFAGVDLLRTTSPIAPTGACNCAVTASPATSGPINDQSNALNSYTVAPGLIASNFTSTIALEAISTGVAHLIYREKGALICDLALGCGSGGGTIGTINATAPVLVNGGTTCTGPTCTIALTNFSVAGTYANPASVTLDNFGLVTAITGGAVGTPCIAPGTAGEILYSDGAGNCLASAATITSGGAASFPGQITSTLAIGTAPFSIVSTTLVPNLNVQILNGVTVTGTPSTGQALVATSSTAADWQTPSASGCGSGTLGFLLEFTGSGSTCGNSPFNDIGGTGSIVSSSAEIEIDIAKTALQTFSIPTGGACGGSGNTFATGVPSCESIVSTINPTAGSSSVAADIYASNILPSATSFSGTPAFAGIFSIASLQGSTGNPNFVTGVAGVGQSIGPTGIVANLTGVSGIAKAGNGTGSTGTALMAGVDAQIYNDNASGSPGTEPFATSFYGRTAILNAPVTNLYNDYRAAQPTGVNNPNPHGYFQAGAEPNFFTGSLGSGTLISGGTQCVEALASGQLNLSGAVCSTGGGAILVINSTTTQPSDVSVPANTPTTILSHTVTMPSTGCPCQAIVTYQLYVQQGNSGISVAWVNDGTNSFATSEVLQNGSASNYGIGTAAFALGTYANSAAVTFTLNIENSASGGATALAVNNLPGPQNAWMNIAVTAGGTLTVNGGGGILAPNLQNGTGGNIINVSNPSGSNIQFTVQNASITAPLLNTTGSAILGNCLNGDFSWDPCSGFSPVLTSPALTQTLVYNGTNWVNSYGGVSVDPQTGNYTATCPGDRLGEIEFNISSAATLTLPQAGSTACLQSNPAYVVRNASISTALLTVAATTSLFQPEGVSSVNVLPGGGVFIYSDAVSGTGNYHDLPIATGFGGVNIQTTNYATTQIDKDKIVLMNCTAACVLTLPNPVPSAKWTIKVLSIGSTLATVSLNSLTFNGASTPPTLTTGHTISIASNGTNYDGDISAGGGLSGLTANQTLVGLNATGAFSSPAWAYASFYLPNINTTYGGDYALLFNALLAANLSGTVIWDISGKLKSASNPYNGVAFTGLVNYSVPVAFWTTTTWVQPAQSVAIGTGESDVAGNGTQGTAIIACPGVSAVCASAFPNDTPVYAFISAARNTSFAGAGTTTQLIGATISGAYVQGARCFQNYYSQENAFVRDVTLRDCDNNGIEMDLGNSSVNGDSDNSNYSGIAMGATNGPTGSTPACTLGAVNIRMNYPNAGTPGPKEIRDVTATHEKCISLGTPVFPNDNVQINGAAVHFVGKFHTENASRYANHFGASTQLFTVNTSGTAATFVSGDPFVATWPTGLLNSTMTIAGAAFTISSCTTSVCTLTTSAGTQTGVPASVDASVGAEDIVFDVADDCCHETSGTASSMFGIENNSNAITVLWAKSLSPHPALNMMVDQNQATTTIARATTSSLSYAIDQNGAILTDSSGIHALLSNTFPELIAGGVSGGIPCFTSITAMSASALLTSNSPLIGGGAGNCPKTASFLTTDGTQELVIGPADTTHNGVLGLKGKTSGTATGTAPAVAGTAVNPIVWSNVLGTPGLSLNAGTCTAAGTAGFICGAEGTAPTNAAGDFGFYSDSTAHELKVATAGSANFGELVRAQPGSIRSTGLVASVNTATLCSATAGACNIAGTYHVHVALYQSGTACSANTTNGVSPTLTWTDGNGTAHSAQTIPMSTNASLVALSGTMAWGATTLGAWGSGDINIDTNGTQIQYSIVFAQCTTGTATYAASLVTTRLQ